MNANCSEIDILTWNNSMKLHKEIFSPVLAYVSMCISIFGTATNCLVTIILAFKFKRNSSTTYILNLSMADTFFLLCLTILDIIHVFLDMIPLSDPIQIINVIFAFSFICIFGYNASLCILTAFSVERCLSVLYPIWYHCKRPQHLSAVMCCIIWIFTSLFTVLEFLFCYRVEYKLQYQQEMCDAECKVFFVIICCINFIIFTPFMTLSSLILLIKIWSNSKRQQPPKLYIVVTLSVFFFLVFGIPMRILLLIWYRHQSMPPFPITNLVCLFGVLYSSINPFIYYFVGRKGTDVKKLNFLVILRGAFHEERSQCKRNQKNEIISTGTIM
ncbi:proto-oncogene Mas-like [Bombina bombina]|uniref:proto-oncogene Mas-like n=1 Tax=Bombina bombina TaxID=8345 RepID=UPI00235AEC9A|nr:proto-oncogene Mas-like [Bombina bombina]